MAGCLYDNPRSVPLSQVCALLVLDEDSFSYCQRPEGSRVFLQGYIVRLIRVQGVLFAAYAWRQVGRKLRFEYFSSQLTKESVFCSGRSKMICAGDMLQSRSRVLRSCSIAYKNLSLLKLPVGRVFDISRRFVVLTALSALPFN